MKGILRFVPAKEIEPGITRLFFDQLGGFWIVYEDNLKHAKVGDAPIQAGLTPVIEYFDEDAYETMCLQLEMGSPYKLHHRPFHKTFEVHPLHFEKSRKYRDQEVEFTVNLISGKVFIRGAVPKEAPVWYTDKQMFNHLKNNHYSDHIAQELSEEWAELLQVAFTKGWEKGKNDDRMPDAEYVYFSDKIKDLCSRAHWHGWFCRERYDGPDKHGYENWLPAGWKNMDYDEREDWFFERFWDKNYKS